MQVALTRMVEHSWCITCSLNSYMHVQIQYLKGLKYLYRLGVFLYAMMGFVGLTLLFLILRGPLKWKRRTLEDVYAA